MRGKAVSEFVGSVSTKGQVTIPNEMRRKLGLNPGDKVRMTIEDEKIVLRPAGISLLAGFMSIPALKKPLTDDDITEIATEAAVDDAAHDLDQH